MFFRIASTFPYVDLFFLHYLSYFCTKSWAMVPTSFVVGTGPGTLVAIFFSLLSTKLSTLGSFFFFLPPLSVLVHGLDKSFL